MSNWPGFAMLVGCAISTLLATKVSKKVLCQIGVGFVVAYAILGFSLHSSFVMLMMWQTILGLGFGFLMPTSNGIIAENYDEEGRSKIMGIQDLFTNGGGMYLTLIGGVLAAKAWNYTYLAFLYALIPLVLGCIYFPADKPAEAKGEKNHLKVAPITWLFGVIIFVFINSYGVMGANIAYIITGRGFGGPALIGTAMSIFLVGGMVCASLTLSGITSTGIIPACINAFNNEVSEENKLLATGIAESGVNIGAFLGTPFIAIVQAFGGTPDSTMFFTPIIMMILGFITLKFYKNAKA